MYKTEESRLSEEAVLVSVNYPNFLGINLIMQQIIQTPYKYASENIHFESFLWTSTNYAEAETVPIFLVIEKIKITEVSLNKLLI